MGRRLIVDSITARTGQESETSSLSKRVISAHAEKKGMSDRSEFLCCRLVVLASVLLVRELYSRKLRVLYINWLLSTIEKAILEATSPAHKTSEHREKIRELIVRADHGNGGGRENCTVVKVLRILIMDYGRNFVQIIEDARRSARSSEGSLFIPVRNIRA